MTSRVLLFRWRYWMLRSCSSRWRRVRHGLYWPALHRGEWQCHIIKDIILITRHARGCLALQNSIWKDYEVDAYLVVFSITDRRSFEKADEFVLNIRKEGHTSEAIIIVANKSDLVRSRMVAEDGTYVTNSSASLSNSNWYAQWPWYLYRIAMIKCIECKGRKFAELYWANVWIGFRLKGCCFVASN